MVGKVYGYRSHFYLSVELTSTLGLQEEDHIAIAELSAEEAPLPSLQDCYGHLVCLRFVLTGAATVSQPSQPSTYRRVAYAVHPVDTNAPQ